MTDRSTITLSKRETLETDDGDYRLRIWVSRVTNEIPYKVFVYQHLPYMPDDTDERTDLFVHVASYADLLAFPEDAPDDYSPFFRAYYLDLTMRNTALLAETWTLIKAHTRLLVEDYVRIHHLPPAEIEELEL